MHLQQKALIEKCFVVNKDVLQKAVMHCTVMFRMKILEKNILRASFLLNL